jgi:hypothetical protein
LGRLLSVSDLAVRSEHALVYVQGKLSTAVPAIQREFSDFERTRLIDPSERFAPAACVTVLELSNDHRDKRNRRGRDRDVPHEVGPHSLQVVQENEIGPQVGGIPPICCHFATSSRGAHVAPQLLVKGVVLANYNIDKALPGGPFAVTARPRHEEAPPDERAERLRHVAVRNAHGIEGPQQPVVRVQLRAKAKDLARPWVN